MTTSNTSTNPVVLIFGREPAAILGAIQAFLVLAVSFGWLSALHITGQNDVAIVVTVLSAISAVYTAYKTNETVLSPVIQLFQAGLSLAAIYGFHMTNEQTGFVVVLITSVAALFHRSQVTPLASGSFSVLPPSNAALATPVASTPAVPVVEEAASRTTQVPPAQ